MSPRIRRRRPPTRKVRQRIFDRLNLRSGFVPPSGISTEKWGEQNRELSTQTSAAAGPWSMAMIPAFRMVLEALDDDAVEKVCIEKATQVAGSESVLTWLLRQAAEDPGPAMWVFSDKDTAEEFADTRIKPAIRSSPVLSSMIIESKFGQGFIQLANGFSLVMAWSSSISKTASRPIRYLVLDEITKPGYGRIGVEGSSIMRIIERTESYSNRKIVMLSSVTVITHDDKTGEITGDNMAVEMAKCRAIYEHAVPCPKCGVLQPLRFFPESVEFNGETITTGYVKFPDGDTPEARAAAATYQCAHCDREWTTAERNAAVMAGVGVARTKVSTRPKSCGFHIDRLVGLFPGGRLDALAEGFLVAKSKPNDLKAFYNNSLAMYWRPYKIPSSEEDLRKAIVKEVAPSVVPAGADCLVLTIDMQQSGFWYLIRAWSARTWDSWMIECGTLVSWDEVKFTAFERTFTRPDGTVLPIWRTMLDTGGTKAEGALVSRTEEAYLWWLHNRPLVNRRFFLTKGSSSAMPSDLNMGKVIETTPSGRKIEHGGLRVVQLNTCRLKDLFFASIAQAKKRESRAAYLNSAVPDLYFRHITAEVKGDDDTYKQIRPDNHLLDCEMQQRAAVSNELMGGLESVRHYLDSHSLGIPDQATPPAPGHPDDKPQPTQIEGSPVNTNCPWPGDTSRDTPPWGGRRGPFG